MLPIGPATLLHIFAIVTNFVFLTVQTGESWWNKLNDIITELTQPKIYGFFNGTLYPYLLQMTQLYATGSAKLQLVFCMNDRTFFPYQENDNFAIERPSGKPSSLPILSLEVMDVSGAKVFYDLTDFVETLRCHHIKGLPVPSVAHIINVWQMFSRIVIDTDRFKARYINNNGDTVNVALTDSTPLIKDVSPDTDSTLSSGSDESVTAETNTAEENRAPA